MNSLWLVHIHPSDRPRPRRHEHTRRFTNTSERTTPLSSEDKGIIFSTYYVCNSQNKPKEKKTINIVITQHACPQTPLQFPNILTLASNPPFPSPSYLQTPPTPPLPSQSTHYILPGCIYQPSTPTCKLPVCSNSHTCILHLKPPTVPTDQREMRQDQRCTTLE
jgi:hypothetical protein